MLRAQLRPALVLTLLLCLITGVVYPAVVTGLARVLDPDISPANARLQVARVARARNVDAAALQRLVDARTAGRQLGLLGEPRVNVLLLNLAVDSAFPVRR